MKAYRRESIAALYIKVVVHRQLHDVTLSLGKETPH